MAIEEPAWVDEVKPSKYDLDNLPDSIESEIWNCLTREFAPDEIDFLKYIGAFSVLYSYRAHEIQCPLFTLFSH